MMKQLKTIICLFALIFTISTSMPGLAQEVEKEEKEKEKVFELDQTVVTGTRTPHLVKDSPVETVVITAEDIEKSGAQTVEDLIRDIPGFLIETENVPGVTTAWRGMIRGLKLMDYGLILVDGQRTKADLGILLTQVPMEVIDHIEVVKGPGSVLYGSDAMAATINIITKPPTKPFVNANIGYGYYDSNRVGLACGTKIDKFGIVISASHEGANRGRFGGEKIGAIEPRYRRSDILTKLSYDITETLDIGLDVQEYKSDRNEPSGGPSGEYHIDLESIRYAPSIKKTFTDGSKLLVRGYWRDNYIANSYRKSEVHTYYTEGEFQYTKPLGKSHLVTFGGEYFEEEIDSMYYKLEEPHFQADVNTKSIYLQDEIEFFLLGKPLVLVPGIRLDHHSQFGSAVCPKVSVLYEMSEDTRVRASVGRGFRAPSVEWLFQDVQMWNLFYANPDLEPEYSIGYSLSLDQKITERYLFNLGLFRNDYEDLISSVYVGPFGTNESAYTRINIAKAYTQGLEFSLKAYLFKGISAIGGYTYLDAKDKETDQRLPNAPEHTVSGQLIYENEPWGLSFSVSMQYVVERFKSLGGEIYGEYLVTDANLIKKIQTS